MSLATWFTWVMDDRTATKPVLCADCGKVLSADGLRWVANAHRLSRRSFDGTPIRGDVSRPDTKGPKRCRRCIDLLVEAKRSDLRKRTA